DTGVFEPGNKLIVVETVLTCGRPDSNDPKPPEVALPRFPVAIGVNQSLLYGLFGKLVQLALVEVVTLGEAEKLFPAIVTFCSAFNSRHFWTPLLARLCVRQHPANFRRVGRIRNRCFAQFSLSTGRFFGEDVAREGMVSFHLSCPGNFEALGGAFMRF